MIERETPVQLAVSAMAGVYETLSPLSYPLIRVVAGVWLMPHGAQKLFGAFGGDAQAMAGFFSQMGIEPALAMVYAAGAVEFFGGLLIALGLFTRPAAVAATVLLAVAVLKIHLGAGFFLGNGGYEYALMWLLITLAIVFRGGGRFSVDRRLGFEF